MMRVLCVIMLLTLFAPRSSPAQSEEGYSLDLVEVWIRGKVSPQRAWNRDLSKSGISFRMTPEAIARLRLAGAGEEWIMMLRRARFNPPDVVAVGAGPDSVPVEE